MASIAIAYTPVGGGTTYNFEFKDFSTSSFPRSYTDRSAFDISATGATVMSGLPIRRRYQWTISAPLSRAQAVALDDLFRAWEEDRALGAVSALGVVDSTFGNTLNTSAVFTSAPIYDQYGPSNVLVSFGLTEV